METVPSYKYRAVIDDVCLLNWTALSSEEMMWVAWAYYYFSVQFRENLGIARSLFPDDDKLRRLEAEECDTDNLSPWPGVAEVAEKMDHDEFMRRTLALTAIDEPRSAQFSAAGRAYLQRIQELDPICRALSIASYEDGGLEKVFRAILGFRDWNGALLQGFEHFLSEHVRFDSDPAQGHGALSRHMTADDRVLPLWLEFRELLLTCVPRLRSGRNRSADGLGRENVGGDRDLLSDKDELALASSR